jgi:hypothetical protein
MLILYHYLSWFIAKIRGPIGIIETHGESFMRSLYRSKCLEALQRFRIDPNATCLKLLLYQTTVVMLRGSSNR